jgi:hypothetical protein
MKAATTMILPLGPGYGCGQLVADGTHYGCLPKQDPFMDVGLEFFAVDDGNKAMTTRQLATVMSAGRARFDTIGPGKV